MCTRGWVWLGGNVRRALIGWVLNGSVAGATTFYLCHFEQKKKRDLYAAVLEAQKLTRDGRSIGSEESSNETTSLPSEPTASSKKTIS